MLLFTSLKPYLAKVHVYGSWGLDFCFTLLCLRFIGANFYEAQGYPVPTLVIVGIYFGLACWRPRAALFVFTITVPLLNGLSKIQLITSASPLLLSFSALSLGNFIRQLFAKKYHTENKSLTDLVNSTRVEILTVDFLITVLLVSGWISLWPQRHQPNFWATVNQSSVLGYNNLFYASHSAFLWLQGLYFYKIVIKYYKYNATKKCSPPSRLETQTAMPAKQHLLEISKNSSDKFLIITIVLHTLALLAFSLTQFLTDIPKRYGEANALSSPYEDIHSLGAVTVSILAGVLAYIKSGRKLYFAVQLSAIAAMSVLIIMTWSRITWLAAVIGIFLFTGFKLKKRWLTIFIFFSIVAWWAGQEFTKKSHIWTSNHYMVRLHSLIRIESISEKSSHRFELYHKALEMIIDQPFTGFGIGSFYLTSPKFAQPGDALGPVPNFAHNFVLQFAAELGIPATLLFCSLIGAAWYKGLRHTRAALKEKNGDRVPLALFLALTTYLITQMTANSLNIYVSHQFLFWFLIAALITLPDSKTENRPHAIG